MKGTAGIPSYMILIIGSIAFGLLVLWQGYLFTVGSLHGLCWQSTLEGLQKIQGEASSLEIGQSRNVFVEFGDCTDAVIIMNREQFETTLVQIGGSADTKFSCLEGVKTTLAAVKKVEDSPSWVDLTKALAQSDRKTIEQWTRAYAGLDKATHCTQLKCANCTLTGKGLTLQISSKSDKYCFNIKRESKLEYTVRADTVEKEDRCLIDAS